MGLLLQMRAKGRLDGGRMNEAWKRMAKKYIDCYEAINTLESADIFDEEEAMVHKVNLLKGIIEDFRSEVEE